MSLANFVQVTLSAAATASQTTLTVATPLGGYTLPPSDGGTLVLTDSPGAPTKFEIVTYASRTGTGPFTLTGVTRGVEGTAGTVWGIGAYVVQSITAGGYTADLAGKQATLVSGTNIKTINGKSVLGAGDLVIEGGGGGKLTRSARTSNTALAASDAGKLIDLSGAFTQTLAAAATLADGWFCYLRNSGTGNITLDPSGSELIDGLSSYIMYPGETRLVQCDGVTLRSVVLSGFYREFLSSGTFACPPGYRSFDIYLLGGGGAGSAGETYSGEPNKGIGGGGGAAVREVIPADQLGTSFTIVMGAGGTSGGDGGTTYIRSASWFTFLGAAGGKGGNNGGLPGSEYSPDWGGAPGGAPGKVGGSSPFGGAGGGGGGPFLEKGFGGYGGLHGLIGYSSESSTTAYIGSGGPGGNAAIESLPRAATAGTAGGRGAGGGAGGAGDGALPPGQGGSGGAGLVRILGVV